MVSPGGTAELHRTPFMRVIGGPALQPLFVIAFVVLIIAGIARSAPIALIIAAVALIGLLIGATAWVRVDETGIHRRCFVPRTDLWSDITRVELYTMSFGVNSASRMIRIHRAHSRHWLAPATGNGRHVEDFARQLVAAARARGVTVTTSGWGGFDE